VLNLISRLHHAVGLHCDDHPRDLVSRAVRRLIRCQNVKNRQRGRSRDREVKRGC
jgi:hypothetical protein